jgi:catechol 2,3-dioxygenase-like lactoylglutathione lyase family enzyme
MSVADLGSDSQTKTLSPGVVEMNIEVIVLPVGDVDRAKRFYESQGWRPDADVDGGPDFRLVQSLLRVLDARSSSGSTSSQPRPGTGLIPYLVVSDIEAACNELIARDVQVSEVFHEGQPGGRFHDAGRVSGLSADRGSYGAFASFSDPDGNKWLIQEVTTRLPGRIDPGAINYASASDLAEALRRAEQAHGEHEKRIGAADPNWPDWYAKYLVAERTGSALPS